MKRTIFRVASQISPKTHVHNRFPTASVRGFVSRTEEDHTPEVEPGQHVVAACKQHGIFFPSENKFVKGLKLGGNPFKLSVRASQRHCLEVKSMKYFDKVEHPFTKSLLDIYIEKTNQPLWLSCFAYGASPFPNKTASRKLRHALRDALAAAGYDRFGRKVLTDGESSAIADLYGTLSVVSSDSKAVCNAKFVDLLEAAKSILSSAEIQLRRDKNGRQYVLT
ncbi:hypothetical protein F5Y19DRAFT_334726 [Xylariaceae sp. FL1651]|nr:hypothetical protein F5Y19DRAFT_334726 [Xylariaceae sp. FL1651]